MFISVLINELLVAPHLLEGKPVAMVMDTTVHVTLKYRPSPTYPVLCFPGFRVKRVDNIRFCSCHKVTPNGIDVDQINVLCVTEN